MSTTTITLTDDARYAATWALVDDLNRMAERLVGECEAFTNATPAHQYARAEDVADIARQIGDASQALTEFAAPLKAYELSAEDRTLIREEIVMDVSGLGDIAISIDEGDTDEARRHLSKAECVMAMLDVIGITDGEHRPVSASRFALAREYAWTASEEVQAMLDNDGGSDRDRERRDALRRFAQAVK